MMTLPPKKKKITLIIKSTLKTSSKTLTKIRTIYSRWTSLSPKLKNLKNPQNIGRVTSPKIARATCLRKILYLSIQINMTKDWPTGKIAPSQKLDPPLKQAEQKAGSARDPEELTL